MAEIESIRILLLELTHRALQLHLYQYMDHNRMTYLKKKTSFYDDVIVEIKRAYTRSPYVLVVGDFNCKLKSNLQNVAPNGKLLEQVIYDFNMRVENTLPLCEGQRT